MSTLAPAVAPKPIPKLGPTPIQLPVVQTYVLGDFMRAFGIDESVIRLAQQGFSAGDFSGVTISGVNAAGVTIERTTLNFHDVMRDATIMLDTASQTSITEQLSRRLAGSISYSANTMRRKGLAIRYSYDFSRQGNANFAATLQRYGLVSAPPDTYPPGTAMRQVYSVSHKPTGAHITHSSAWSTR